MLAAICASGAAASLTPGTAWRDVVTSSACSSSPLAMFVLAIDRAVGKPADVCVLLASCGVSERPKCEGVGSEVSLALGLSKSPSRKAACDAKGRVWSGSAGDWLSSVATSSSTG